MAKKGAAPYATPRFSSFLFSCRVDRNLLSIPSLSLEPYDTVNESEQCIITAASYVDTWMDLRTALSVKDISSFYKLSVSSLGAKSLGLGISAVLGRTNSLFMSE